MKNNELYYISHFDISNNNESGNLKPMNLKHITYSNDAFNDDVFNDDVKISKPDIDLVHEETPQSWKRKFTEMTHNECHDIGIIEQKIKIENEMKLNERDMNVYVILLE
eukprot:CAMPEP_0114671206 /NCGR_PEP_ID=MMETSP0191-20121206/40767_1 /TAXON_ID=126664 /ORGANISM="Sorites sp." /LENGTH=108 /DNA_ID=CAMNT_0001930499 /DNA_START=203 /DNA_END=529 /DNA_ORIENTATION=+